MASSDTQPAGPDFSTGLPLSVALQGVTGGHVGGEAVLLWRQGDVFSAVGGACTHYGGPLAAGLVVGSRVHCPWHHACFDLRTGKALSAPAIDPLARWKVEVEGEKVFVRERLEEGRAPLATAPQGGPARIVIVGGGGAGFAAAEMLRRRGYAGSLTMLSADDAPPCDRPNLSKDYLAGTAPEEWIPLKGEDFYADNRIDLRLNTEVVSIDPAAKAVVAASGERFEFDALLLATGAEPVRLDTPGFDRPNVHTLRSLADSRALVAAAQGARSVAVIGSSFIGLEVAASLRARGLEVHVVAPENVPLGKVLGEQLGAFIRILHERNGVTFHLGQTAQSFDGHRLSLSGGGAIEVDFVVMGVGVRPRIALAQAAGLAVDRGVLVDEFLETSAPGIYAAGDIARYPNPHSGEPMRIEHWVVAERLGQAAAMNMLGERKPFTHEPFFWSNHGDVAVRYVGYAPDWDAADVEGVIADGAATVRFKRGDEVLAAASLGRDKDNLEIEQALTAAGRRR